MVRYYFLIATQSFLFEQEPIEEILRERVRHYQLLNKELDFSLTTNIDFLNQLDQQHIKNSFVSPAVAVISVNPRFINWLKLRMQYVLTGSFSTSNLIEFSNLIQLKYNNYQ
uniref:Uncharacterized protein n=1 Tax=Neogoniolithon spectabile TaxID=231755 RepID=A0A3G3MH68_9FLOR|nr:hypothetical protein [Neogoniolithon spectabile]AYR06151.1 hypothetical protein [Neogoniolithon spectabile]